jgi:uncharacterized RDD family membrane protein YckC
LTLYSPVGVGQNADMTSVSNRNGGNDRQGPGLAGRVLGAMVGPLVTPVVDQVDVDEVVSRIDVDQVLRRVDLDELLERIDIEAVLDRIDPDRLLDRMDLNRVLARVDVNGLVDRIDLDPLLDRVNLDQVLGRVDLDAVVGRIDINAIVQRLDVDAVVERVDINRVLQRVDTVALVSHTEFGALIAKSTSGVFAKVLDVLRNWVMTLDVLLNRVVNRVFHRRRPTEAPSQAGWTRDQAFQGAPAGMVSRLFAFLIDVFTVQLLLTVGQALFALAFQVVLGRTWSAKDHQLFAAIAWGVLVFLYFTVPIAVAGRTVGQAVLGLKVQRLDGATVGGSRAVVRTLTFPLSILLFGIGLFMGVFRADRRMLHDLIAGTEEIYAWDARAAGLRSLAEHATPAAA